MPTSKFKTVEEYFARLPERDRDVLEKLRETLRRALPKAEEVISYAMPAFRQEGIVVWYAAAKDHYAIYVYPRVMGVFKEELTSYKGTKSAIHFAYDKPLPARLITKIAKESLRQNLEKPRNK